MSEQAEEQPEIVTYKIVAFKELHDDIAGVRKQLAEMRAQMIECLKTGPKPIKAQKDEEIIKLKQEIVELKKENASLKQQLSELWDKFKIAVGEKTASASKAFSSLFSKNKKVKAETSEAESSNSLSM